MAAGPSRVGGLHHLTAARLREWWLPDLPELAEDGAPVFLAVHRRHPRPKRPQLRVRRHPRQVDHELVGGLRVATPAETLLACAVDLAPLDLVVQVDSALHLGHVTPAELAAVTAPRRRGGPRLRAAAAVADGRSESAWETLLRRLHRACDVAVEPQHRVLDADGSELARADLWIRGTTTVQEYDGSDHRRVDRQRGDRRRNHRLARADWSRNGYTAADLTTRAVTVLRDADHALRREHDPARIRAWHELLRASSYTAAGRRRLRDRLGLPPMRHDAA